MRKICGISGLILLAATGSALASGYRIPEQSVNSVARAGGYVAYTPGADSTYYNPANMAWQENRFLLEADATWIHLTSVNYTDYRSPTLNGTSEHENFFMPTFFAVSPDYNNFRFGLSFTAPAGLAKKWHDPHPRTYAEEFSLKIFEINPTVAYRFNDKVSIGAGVRAVYVDGTVRSNGDVSGGMGIMASRDMDGDAWAYGYNLALSIRPVDKLNIGLTYRSKVNLGVEGHANLNTNLHNLPYPPYSPIPNTLSTDAAVDLPLPAVLALAVSYTFFDQLTVELGYERTYWSSLDSLDFTYPTTLTNPAWAGFGPVRKSWSDTNTWRLSLTYDMKNNWVLMAGFAIDENPAPDSTLSYELPDADALLFSLGVRYKINKDMEVGLAYLFDDKESRSVSNDPLHYGVNGKFENEAAHLVTIGFSYNF